METILVCLGLFAVVAFLLWAMLAFVGGRTSRALQETARTLGLSRVAPEPGGREASKDVVYAGTVEGIAVRVGSGMRVTTTVQPTIVGVVGVGATFPRPLGFNLTIGLSGTPLQRTLKLGDKQFDRACIVMTDNPDGTRAALASEETRDAVREFLKHGGSSAIITNTEVYVGIFNAHISGSRVILDAVRRAVRACRALSPP